MFSKKEIIILLPIVVVFVMLNQLFEFSALWASVFSLLTIPITTIIQVKLFSDKDVFEPVIQNAMQNNQSEEARDIPSTSNFVMNFWLSTALVIFVIVVFISVINTNYSGNTRQAEEITPTDVIKNPEYIGNKSFYLLDTENIVDASIPLQTPIYVESIKRLENNKMLVLTVSYPATVAGQNIFKVTDVYVPGVAMMVCNGDAEKYIESKIVGKYILAFVTSIDNVTTIFTTSIFAQLYAAESDVLNYTDLSHELVSSGYAKVQPQSPISLYGGIEKYQFESKIKYYNSQDSNVDVNTFNANASVWFEQLSDEQQVAKLAKRGSWQCADK